MKFSGTRQSRPQSNFKINYYFCESLKKSEIPTYYQQHSSTTNEIFGRSNITFTKKCIIYLLVLYLKLTLPYKPININRRTINFMHIIFPAAVQLGSEAAVWKDSEKYV